MRHVYVPKTGYHLLIGQVCPGGVTKLDRSCPSSDELFSDSAEHFERRLIGVALSGSPDRNQEIFRREEN